MKLFTFKSALLQDRLALIHTELSEDGTNPSITALYVTQVDETGVVSPTVLADADQLKLLLADRTVVCFDATREIPALLKLINREFNLKALVDVAALYHSAQLLWYKEIRLIDIYRDIAYEELDFYKETLYPFADQQTCPKEALETVVAAATADFLLKNTLVRRYEEGGVPSTIVETYVNHNMSTQMESALYLYESNYQGFTIDVAEMEAATKIMKQSLIDDEVDIRALVQKGCGWETPKPAPSLLDGL